MTIRIFSWCHAKINNLIKIVCMKYIPIANVLLIIFKTMALVTIAIKNQNNHTSTLKIKKNKNHEIFNFTRTKFLEDTFFFFRQGKYYNYCFKKIMA